MTKICVSGVAHRPLLSVASVSLPIRLPLSRLCVLLSAVHPVCLSRHTLRTHGARSCDAAPEDDWLVDEGREFGNHDEVAWLVGVQACRVDELDQDAEGRCDA